MRFMGPAGGPVCTQGLKVTAVQVSRAASRRSPPALPRSAQLRAALSSSSPASPRALPGAGCRPRLPRAK